jgi:phasin
MWSAPFEPIGSNLLNLCDAQLIDFSLPWFHVRCTPELDVYCAPHHKQVQRTGESLSFGGRKEMSVSNRQPSQIASELRAFAEKSVAQARGAFDTLVENARRASDTVQSSADTAHNNGKAVLARGLALTEQNITTGFDHAQKLVQARSLKDAVTLQAEFARSQFTALQAQVKELASLAKPTKA